MLDRYRIGFDKLGIFISGVCLVHCLLLPFLFIFFPIIQELIPHDHFHALIFIPILIVSTFAFVPAYRKMRKKRLLILPLIAISIFIATELIPHIHSGYAYNILNALAGVLLLSTHLYNLKHSRCCLKHH